MKRQAPIVPAGCEYYCSQADMSQELNERLRRCAQEFGETYAAFLVTEMDREYFWCSERRGVVGYRRLGRYVIVGDGLLAAPEDRELLLKEFLSFAKENRWRPTFMNVPRNEINMFRRHECQVTKCGEEPLVRLQRTEWHGKQSQWVRRQENFCKRHGVEVCEIIPDSANAVYVQEIAPQLEEISRAHLASTLHRKEMRFFVSQFSAKQLSGKRLFVARTASRIVAFIVCNPGLNGDLWAVEVYRRRPDAARGAIPFVIMHAMRAMKGEGVRYFSLSLAPFLRCTPMIGDSVIFRSVANLWWRFLNPVYDVRGLFHFKSRFRPDYREMYLASKPRVTVISLFAIAFVWKLFHFNPLRLIPRALRHKWIAKQGDLATSEARPARVIRHLRPYPAGAIARCRECPPTVVEDKQFGETRAQETIPV
jgi:phosphatidylglycerol lysyltransferase